MIRSRHILSVLLGSLPFAIAQNNSQPAGPPLPDVLTADYIATLGNNSLFLRWRPTYHFISPAGWMNVGLALH
jgi:beta-fructofuranosidase